MTEVRLATADDVEAIITTVVAAFDGDPAWGFMIGDDAAARVAFARTLLLPRLALRTVWIAEDAAAVAMWDRRALDPPADPVRDEGWRRFRADAGEVIWQQLEAYEDALGKVAPPRPHWYLGVLATRPDAQGRGLATAVLQPGFAAAADDSWDCWLETSTEENKAFYGRRGFSHDVPATAPSLPPTWWLQRPHGDRLVTPRTHRPR